MAILTEHQARFAARHRAALQGRTVEQAFQAEARLKAPRYDIFLSQTIHDREIVYGVYATLRAAGKTVFVDWIEQPGADRSSVTPENAAYIRGRMAVSDSLLFIDSEQADRSCWMCWEVGWFDAKKERLAVFPIHSNPTNIYRGREFLGLYPYVEIDSSGNLIVSEPPDALGRKRVAKSITAAPTQLLLDGWLRGPARSLRPAA
jgi:hypothetical protein